MSSDSLAVLAEQQMKVLKKNGKFFCLAGLRFDTLICNAVYPIAPVKGAHHPSFYYYQNACQLFDVISGKIPFMSWK